MGKEPDTEEVARLALILAVLGDGEEAVLEITDIIDQLHLEGGFDVDSLPVRIVPVRPIGRKSELSIGRISIFRQGR
jgi:tyrosinase